MRANRAGPGRPSPGLRPDPASGVPPAPAGRGLESRHPGKMKRLWMDIALAFSSAIANFNIAATISTNLRWGQGSINAADPPLLTHRHADAGLAHDPAERPQILILAEHRGCRIAPVDHVVAVTPGRDSGRSRHGGSRRRTGPSTKNRWFLEFSSHPP